MKYKFRKVESPSYIDCNYDIWDTELGNIDMEDFWNRVKSSSQTPWMKSIVGSGLPLATGFPMSAQCLEFILACASNYDSASRSLKNQVGEVIIKLDGGYFDDLLKLPNFEEYGDVDLKSAQKSWDNDQEDCIKHVNKKFLIKAKPAVSRFPRLVPRSDFIQEINDIITLLSRVFGFPESNVFQGWMYQFMVIIKKNQQGIDWGSLISNEIDSQMTTVLSTGKFYMSSYVTYAAAGMRNYPGLDTKGNKTVEHIYRYFPQLTRKGSEDQFRRVNDAFFYENICRLNLELRKTRVSDEAWAEVSKWGCVFLQFKKFTYLQVVMYLGDPFRLPRYPGDKLILMELVRQLLDFHKFQQSKHKAAVSFPISIGRYTCSTVVKSKNVVHELQDKLKKHMKPRDGFDF
ncbi:hypothetical protein KI387_018570 [Taxus chinensis]|uniref:Uncharacterized protein n=1 Tax=Taxus chinensis TaxID=29808 RepID=A0AA38LHM7_TAXCH|nr:hypothetical protein KI387_018570 [Taxus chinensis]